LITADVQSTPIMEIHGTNSVYCIQFFAIIFRKKNRRKPPKKSFIVVTFMAVENRFTATVSSK